MGPDRPLAALHRALRDVATQLVKAQQLPGWDVLTAPQQHALAGLADLADGADPHAGTFRVQFIHRASVVGEQLARTIT